MKVKKQKQQSNQVQERLESIGQRDPLRGQLARSAHREGNARGKCAAPMDGEEMMNGPRFEAARWRDGGHVAVCSAVSGVASEIERDPCTLRPIVCGEEDPLLAMARALSTSHIRQQHPLISCLQVAFVHHRSSNHGCDGWIQGRPGPFGCRSIL